MYLNHAITKINYHETLELRIGDLFVWVEVVSKVKLGYCSPFQLIYFISFIFKHI